MNNRSSKKTEHANDLWTMCTLNLQKLASEPMLRGNTFLRWKKYGIYMCVCVSKRIFANSMPQHNGNP